MVLLVAELAGWQCCTIFCFAFSVSSLLNSKDKNMLTICLPGDHTTLFYCFPNFNKREETCLHSLCSSNGPSKENYFMTLLVFHNVRAMSGANKIQNTKQSGLLVALATVPKQSLVFLIFFSHPGSFHSNFSLSHVLRSWK